MAPASTPPASTANQLAAVPAASASAAQPAAPVPSAATATPQRYAKSILTITAGLATPESVLYDAAEDRYLVSNINGSPVATDDNGFISEISPEGKVTRLKFIEGGVGKVKLNAPKGMGIANGVLYVADITAVRKFDAKSGAPKGEIAIAGATFLNDVAIAKDGKIYVSDSGLKGGAKGLEPDGSDAVYVIEGNKPKAIARSKDLAGPNGLVLVGNDLIVVTFGADEAYKLSADGKKSEVTKLPGSSLDGIVFVNDELLISSWQASAVYHGKMGSTFEVLIPGVKAPADIGYDTKRRRVLVPHFTENSVEIFEMP